MERVEVITRGERRRAWTAEQKRAIVLESLAPAVRSSDVARRHGINTGLLYTWRRQMVDGQLGERVRAAPSFRPQLRARRRRAARTGPGSFG